LQLYALKVPTEALDDKMTVIDISLDGKLETEKQIML